MGRAKKKFRDRLYTQAFFGEALIGRYVPQVPQRALSQAAGEAETPGETHEEQDLAGRLVQTVAEQSAQTLESKDMKEDKLELDNIRRARALFRQLNSQVTEDKPLLPAKYDQYGQYDEELDSCYKEFVRLTESYAKNIREEIATIKATYQDTTKPSIIRAEARMHQMKLTLAARMETVDLCLCMTQLFNVQKMFCWTVFGYNRVRIDQAARHGIQLKQEPTGALMQIDNDLRRPAAEDTKRDKKERAPRKSNLTALLAGYHRNIVQLLKDVQAINNSVKEEEDKVPCLSDLTVFFNRSVTVDIPKHIHQSLSDILFLLDEMDSVRPDVIAQRNTLLKSLTAWRAVDKEFWECNKSALHQNPVSAKYEYTRRSFLALYLVWSQEESKAYDYFHNHGLLEKLEPAMKERLGWQPSDWQRSPQHDGEAERAWQSHFDQLKDILPSVEQLVSQCEEAWDKSAQGDKGYATTQHDDWWKVLVPRLK